MSEMTFVLSTYIEVCVFSMIYEGPEDLFILFVM